MKLSLHVASVLVAAVGMLAWDARAEPIQGGYATKPLMTPVFDVAHVAVDSAAFNNWLNTSYSSLSPEAMKGPREHLYYLIDSWVSSIYKREGVVFPLEHDLLLQNLFLWSERLGVFGGNLVYDALKSGEAPALPSYKPVPDEFTLSLRRDMLTVQSKSGEWSVAVPYYFMIWNLSEFVANNGPRTQLVTLSTGAAKHEGLDGHSQATLMLLFGPGIDPAEFEAYWSAGIGFTGGERTESLPVSDLESRVKFDPASKLHSEYTSWNTKAGPILVVYMGMNGTYQSNRPHFIDFLRSLRR